jgi:hypothetical protein
MHAAVQLKGILCATCLLQGSDTMYEKSRGNRNLVCVQCGRGKGLLLQAVVTFGRG